jgi:hypothetical protein
MLDCLNGDGRSKGQHKAQVNEKGFTVYQTVAKPIVSKAIGLSNGFTRPFIIIFTESAIQAHTDTIRRVYVYMREKESLINWIEELFVCQR